MPNISSEVFWGKTKVLRCEGEGTPTPSVAWFKDAIALPSTAWSHIAVAANQSLVVNNAGKEDEGIYQCVIRNEAGSASTYTVLKVSLWVFFSTSGNLVKTNLTLVLFCLFLSTRFSGERAETQHFRHSEKHQRHFWRCNRTSMPGRRRSPTHVFVD